MKTKAQTINHKWFGAIALLVLCVAVVMGAVVFTDVLTPTGTTEDSNLTVEYNFTMEDSNPPKEVKWHFNGTNTTIFDESVVGMWNFDNRSALGENDTHVVDISGNGNNGTVVGGTNITWVEDGKYNGAFNFTNISEIDIATIPSFDITNQVSFSYWIKLDKYKTHLWGVISGRGNAYRSAGNIIEADGTLTFNILNSTYVSGDDTAFRYYVKTGVIPLNEWVHITSTYSNETGVLSIYYNGELMDSEAGLTGMGIYDKGGSFNIGSSGSAYAVMNLDDYIYFNKSLTSSEVSQLYKSQLTKYDSENWSFWTNETNLITNTTGIPYNYYLCSTDSSDNENCTTTKTITRVPASETITGNFSSSIYNIHESFYGAVGVFSVVDSNETKRDWYRDKWNDAKLTYNRRDMSFNSRTYYKGIMNWGFEDWYNITRTINETQDEAECFTALGGWGCTAYQFNSTTNVTLSRSTDAHTGAYSLNSTGNGNSSTAHGIFGLVYLSDGTYNLSVWVNSTATVSFYVRNQDDLTYPCSGVSSSGSGVWEELNCNFIISENNTEYKIGVEDFGSSTFLVDDFELLKDGIKTYFTEGNISLQKDLNNWTYQNRDTQKLQWIANYMPYFNANVSTLCGDNTDGRSNYSRCPPLNFTIHGDMAVDFLNETSNNGEWLSVIEVENWNEPYGGGFFLPKGTTADRSYWHNLIYNATKIAVKAYNSSIPFYGMSGYFGTTERDLFVENFISNFTDEDGYTLHTYGQDQTPNDIASVFEADMTKLIGYCTTYGANCSRIIWSEWGTWNHSLKNDSSLDSEYKKLIADAISYQLNNWANITTLIPYQFHDSSSTSEPRWGMVDYDTNSTRAMYNVTKAFATYHSAGSTVYNSSSTSSAVKVTSTNKGNQYAVTIINTDTEAKNISVNLSGAYPYSNITNTETGELITITNDIAQIGVMDSYEIVYLTSGVAPTITNQSPLNSSYSNNATINFTANLTDDVGLSNATIYVYNNSDNSLSYTNTITYVAGEISEIVNWTVTLIDGIYHWFISLWDDEDKNTISSNYTITIDTTAPTISNFQFIALNSSKLQIGTDETAFNFSNLEDIEYMNVTFTLTDDSGINGDIKLYLTANGTNACSLGNNQSATCYNYDSDSWIEFQNGTDTSTFRDIGGSAQGDYITCDWTGTSTERNYTCQIDEHYNPNVWKHYPLNFSDMKWQSGTTERIKKNTVWKVELDTANIPLDADYYKVDFRVNASIGLTPTNNLVVYLCNSSYTTGDPSDSIVPECQLVGAKMPSEFQDDGTKFRGIFTSALTSSLGDIKYVLITTDSPLSKYYSMKTYGKLGSTAVRTSISNDDGLTYTNLSNYETELNINWFYDSISSDLTQTLFKIYSNDTLGNYDNSSIQILSWETGDLNEPPIVDIITPMINFNYSGTFDINWTTAEPNGDSYTTNITLNNGTEFIVVSNLADSVSTYSFDSSTYDGDYNLTVESCENTTGDLFCGNDTHLITIDNTNPLIEYVSPTPSTNQSINSIYVNYTTSDTNDIYSFIDFDSSLVGWYRFEGNANDETGKNNGTVNADLIDNGRFGKSYDFDGTTLVNISNSDSLNISNSITLSAWVKIDAYGSYDRIVAKSPVTSVYPYTIYGLLTDTNTTGTKKVRMELASNGVQHIIHSTSGITEGEWFLITGTHDQSTNQTRLYLNGVLDNSSLFKSYANLTEVLSNISKIDTNSEPVTIGRANYGAGFNGKVDEVLILNRSLSSEEIVALYNSTLTYHNFTNLDDGTHTFTSYVIDQAGNLNETEERSIYIDDTNPTITKYTPASNAVTTTKTQTYLFSASDTNSIENCSLIFNGVTISTNNSINQSINHSFTYTHTSDGTFYWSIECIDEYSNTGTTGNISIQFYTETGGGGGSSYSYYTQCYKLVDNECKYEAVYDSPCPDNYFNTLSLCKASLESVEPEPTIIDKIVDKVTEIFTDTDTDEILPEEESDTVTIFIISFLGLLIVYYGFRYFNNRKRPGLIYKP